MWIDKTISDIIDNQHKGLPEPTSVAQWVLIHKGCGKPIHGLAPFVCYCDAAGNPPPELSEEKQTNTDDMKSLLDKLSKAEEKIKQLNVKLEKASKIISEMKKNE